MWVSQNGRFDGYNKCSYKKKKKDSPNTHGQR